MPAVTISSLEKYLSGRKCLIAAREVLFTAARTYLRPTQRPDAFQLGDEKCNSPARNVSDEEWIANAARGYLTILENADKGRNFRICVLQQGTELRIGIRLPPWHADTQEPGTRRILNTFGAHTPVLTELSTAELLVDWHFSAEQLYTDAQTLEGAVYRISALFESALQSITSGRNHETTSPR